MHTPPTVSRDIIAANTSDEELISRAFMCPFRCSQTLTTLNLDSDSIGAAGVRQLAAALKVNQVGGSG